MTIDRLSPSALDRFRACPKQFFLNDIERAPRGARASEASSNDSASAASPRRRVTMGACIG